MHVLRVDLEAPNRGWEPESPAGRFPSLRQRCHDQGTNQHPAPKESRPVSLRTRVLPVEPISWATARIYGALGGRSHFLRFQRLAKMGKELGAFPAYKCLSTSTSLSEILFSAVSLRVSASPFELAPRVLLLSISRLINAESHTRQWNSALGSFPEYVESHAKRFRRFPLLFRAAGNTASSVNFPVIGSTSRF